MSQLKKCTIFLSLVLGISVTFSQEQNKNLLSNPGFEDSLESWGYEADYGEFGMSEMYFDDPKAVHSGKKGCKLVVTEAGYYDWHVKLKIPWNWKALKDQRYILTFWAKCQAPFKKLPLYFNDGPPNFEEKSNKVFTISPEWVQYAFVFTSLLEDSGAVRLVFHLGLDTGVFYFDDFVLNTWDENSIRVRNPQKNLHAWATNDNPFNIWDIKGRNVSAVFLDKRQKYLPIFLFRKRQKYLPVIDFQQ